MTLTPQGKTVMNRKLIAAICTPWQQGHVFYGWRTLRLPI